jgi:hypothetical protein
VTAPCLRPRQRLPKSRRRRADRSWFASPLASWSPYEVAIGRFMAAMGEAMAEQFPHNAEVWKNDAIGQLRTLIADHDEREVKRALRDPDL